MGEVYFGKPGTSDCDVYVPWRVLELPKNVHVKMLQRQIVQLPTGIDMRTYGDVKWSLTGLLKVVAVTYERFQL